MKKIALITGINGQDGSYLAEFLLSKDYEVHGVIRRNSVFNTERIDHIFHKLYIHHGDLIDGSNMFRLINTIRPHEIYNLAAQSHVKVSFEIPEYSSDVTGIGVLRILEAVRACKCSHIIKIYQASTSELFGYVQQIPQTEITPFYPRSPYGVAKLYAHWIVRNYREAYNMYCTNGILFNHESQRRGRTFVTKKITEAAAKIIKGTQEHLILGNLDSLRDWGHAKDYVEAMWMMLQLDKPDDFVIATGIQYSVRQFCEITFGFCGYDLKWRGEGIDEVGYDNKTDKILIKLSPLYYRPSEVDSLLGDASKAKEKLGWSPKMKFHEIIYDMLSYDFEQNDLKLPSFDDCCKIAKIDPKKQEEQQKINTEKRIKAAAETFGHFRQAPIANHFQ